MVDIYRDAGDSCFKGRLHDREKNGTDPTKIGTVPIVFAKKQ